MNHLIDEFNPVCCNDGHSTYFWRNYTNANIYTVDINPSCNSIIKSDNRLAGVNSYTGDAHEFLKTFNKNIDLLYLDAWDVIPNTLYAEEHLKAYDIIKNKLAENCLILIDDTDIGSGGKGKLLIPELIKDGFKCLITGRQSLFIRYKLSNTTLENYFTNVYENNIWGNNNSKTYKGSSGEGSSTNYNTEYIPFLQNFIKKFSIKSICDLGCGDWQCGNEIYNELDVNYTGYDVYKKMIDTNIQEHPKYTFECLDFQANPDLIKSADLIILKDVLQHWKMDEIYSFLDKITTTKKFKYILICNCSNQTIDNPENLGRSTSLSANYLPLKKYNPHILFTYKTKEVSLIQLH
jgi:trans-aconitate methyltransferase